MICNVEVAACLGHKMIFQTISIHNKCINFRVCRVYTIYVPAFPNILSFLLKKEKIVYTAWSDKTDIVI